MTRFVVCVAALGLLGACPGGSSDDDDDSGNIDSGMVNIPDAGPTPDAPAPACTVTPSYGDVGTVPEMASAAERGTDMAGAEAFVQYLAALNADQDLVSVELYNGFAPFTAGIVPGTYELTGAQLQYKDCGVCVRMFGNATGGMVGQFFMATGGTVVITEVGPTGTGRFKATLTNLTFTHVNIAMDFTSTPVGDGCDTAITNLVADSPIVAAMKPGQGEGVKGAVELPADAITRTQK